MSDLHPYGDDDLDSACNTLLMLAWLFACVCVGIFFGVVIVVWKIAT